MLKDPFTHGISVDINFCW